MLLPPNIIRAIQYRRTRWTEYVAHTEKRRGAYRVLMGKPEGRGPPERPRFRWEDNIRTDLQTVGWGHGLNRSGSGQGRVVGCCECGNEPSASIKYGEFLD